MEKQYRPLAISFDPNSCTGLVNERQYVDELSSRWYGRLHGSALVLDLVEVAYLLSSGRARVLDLMSGKEIEDLNELVSKYSKCFEEFFWPMLTVFKDLRDRGRKIRIVEPMKFLVKDKSGELRLVYILEERSPISVDRVLEVVDEARRNNLKATIAVVSLQGELTYYEVSQVDLRVE